MEEEEARDGAAEEDEEAVWDKEALPSCEERRVSEALVARMISITIPLQSQQIAITGPLMLEDREGVAAPVEDSLGLFIVTRAD